MWLGPIYLLSPYLLCFAVLGLLTLWLVPGFRVTFGNVALFGVGAVIGMLTISHYVFLAFRRMLESGKISVPQKYGDIAFVTIAIIGAEPGGILFVWLAMRLRNEHRSSFKRQPKRSTGAADGP